MYKDNFGKGRVSLFRHFCKAGGTVYKGDITYGFIQGLDRDMAMNMIPDKSILFEIPAGGSYTSSNNYCIAVIFISGRYPRGNSRHQVII